MGDSFVAGLGAADPARRFPDVLQKLLGARWVVVNIAMNGWNTANELEALEKYPYSPEIVILSYYVNDIEGAAWKAGVQRPVVIEAPNGWLGELVSRSYLVNFVYWRLYRFRNAAEMTRIYSDYIRECYANDQIWNLHVAELQSFINFTRDRKVKLVVLVIPDLTDVAGSRPITKKVASFFLNSHIPVIDLTDQLAGRDVPQLVANPFDAHPSENLHREIATVLFEKVHTL